MDVLRPDTIGHESDRTGHESDTKGRPLKTMTPRERMLTALEGGTPDRMPATIHQWQSYHLRKYLGGISALDAFRKFGLDAAITYSPHKPADETPDWRVNRETSTTDEGNTLRRLTITTPGGVLTETHESNDWTSWIVEHMIKHHNDVDLLRKYLPTPRLDREAVVAMHDAIGDDGIHRAGVMGHQCGPWQDACCLYGTERMIMATYDHPDWVHAFLAVLAEKREEYIARDYPGMPFDLVETGGGAASSTVISPTIFRDFCVPVDRRVHDALHAAGQKVVYHTCGGMMPILEDIVSNGCDASETLSPPGVGGDARPAELKERIGAKVALIGGINQFQVLTDGARETIRAHVRACFESYGKDGGYICCPSDHFFETPVANLEAYAAAARECVYG